MGDRLHGWQLVTNAPLTFEGQAQERGKKINKAIENSPQDLSKENTHKTLNIIKATYKRESNFSKSQRYCNIQKSGLLEKFYIMTTINSMANIYIADMFKWTHFRND